MFTKLLATLMILASTSIPGHRLYTKPMTVEFYDESTSLVYCVDSEGYEWGFYDESGSFDHGMKLTCLMDTMGTDETIFDDSLIDVEKG